MILHENEKCPVCDKLFTEDDDIVICPHCGTPHHRECYNSLGHCVNKDKHNTDFEYKSDCSADSDSPIPNPNHLYYNPKSAESNNESKKTVCSQCGAQINNDVPFCNHCGAKQTNAQYSEFNPAQNFGFASQNSVYESSNDTIDGKSVADIACVVVSNSDRFIKKFKENKTVSWNWGAFFFGPLYLFFRKMYSKGFMFLALEFAIPLLSQAVFYDKIKAFMSFVNSIAQGQTYNELMNVINDILANPDGELYAQMLEVYQGIMPVIIISYLSIIVINVVISLFADKFYRNKVLSVIDKVNSNLNNDSSLSVTIMPMMEEEKLSQQDLRKLYLSRMGGVSLFLPMMIAVLMIFLRL